MNQNFNFIQIKQLTEIANNYDIFLIDQWGVLHNGQSAYPNAINVLKYLKYLNKQIIILSNSPRLSQDTVVDLNRLGIVKGYYDYIVTSGDTVRQQLITPTEPIYKQLGNKYLAFIWQDQDLNLMHGLNKLQVSTVAEADFILCSGTSYKHLDHYLPILEQAKINHLPLICTNPDLVACRADGELQMCPGAVAKAYENMGGQVVWHGKPLANIYDYCQNLLPHDSNRCLGIGDSLTHDIKGINNAGGASLLITDGIHKDEIGDASQRLSIESICFKYKTRPNYVMTQLC